MVVFVEMAAVFQSAKVVQVLQILEIGLTQPHNAPRGAITPGMKYEIVG